MLIMTSYKLVIFDFDGVILDSESEHFAAFNFIIKKFNSVMTLEEYYKKYISFDDKAVFQNFFHDNNIMVTDKEIKDMIIEKNNFFELKLMDNAKIFPGVIKLIKELSINFILAIGSGAKRNEIINILEKHRIYNLFETIISADEVSNSKPNPETYLKVLDNINDQNTIISSECVVIEDTPGGIKSAKSANMDCVAITNTFDSSKLNLADVVVDNYNEIAKYLFKHQ